MAIAIWNTRDVISLFQQYGTALLAATFSAWFCYMISLVIYRLYLSPLAKFPGPKLAALTSWYEIYYNIFKKGGGQYIFKIKQMHEKYGPIVRINPFELHVDDPAYFDVVYATNKQFDKVEMFARSIGAPLAAFGTIEAGKHRQRRGAMAAFYSRARSRDHGHRVQMVVDRISRRFSTEYAVAFARPKLFTDAPDFKSSLAIGLSDLLYTSHTFMHFSTIQYLVSALPGWLVKTIVPPIKSVVEAQEEIGSQVADMVGGRNAEAKESPLPTLYRDILTSRLPPEELTYQRLRDEAISTIAAGIDTTKWSLSVACYHILANPEVERRLRAELKRESLTPIKFPIGLRLACAVSERMPRINKTAAWTYRDYVIPPGVPVGMDIWTMHHNTVLFPDPYTFKPERWLGDPKVEPELLEKAGYLPPLDGKTKPLTHYMVGFGKGTRMCVGMYLAYAEIYIGLATIFRRHELELYETSRKDVDIACEMILSLPWKGTKGIRVRVKK
ncbi:Trichodiene oxygenase [Daldinia childiae]|uniref:Trichodiene oxygenase n=1 Tax=Daldinia childiae TaxID=326645 RepID=UPI001445B290|nr:Trichodiene oxygenase [Daldinia childiae]KAF3057972.1 Trichodiene oxygenase [Daldinia childiae]